MEAVVECRIYNMNIIIPPHKLKSREVTLGDIPIIQMDAPEMIKLCKIPLGKKIGALAIAHCQVTDKDPLRFFVTADGDIVINPRITGRYEGKKRELEGCFSYPNLPEITINRYISIMVKFLTLSSGVFIPVEAKYSGKYARIFQHEIDHFNAITIYARNNQ